MAPKTEQLHVLMFPLMAQGHMLPTLDMAKLFASRGVKSTILTTQHNASFFTTAISNSHGLINLKLIGFPGKAVGLPEGLENMDSTNTPEQQLDFFGAIAMLAPQLDEAIKELRPHCLVADFFFPYANEVAARNNIPRLVFLGTSFFSMCAIDCLVKHKPHEKANMSDEEPFTLPGLPDEFKLTKVQLPYFMRLRIENDHTMFLGQSQKASEQSYGTIVNSFYELEPSYVEHYRNVIKRKAWHIGPVSLCNSNAEEKAQRGRKQEESNESCGCLEWLDSKQPDSVLYICFCTTTKFSDAQLQEIALGLEASGVDFIWVVRGERKEEGEEQRWLPEGYEKRIEGKGMIIRGWAPQVSILDHEAIGGFVTHCGWNSVLEGVSAGVPMATWPIWADQFYNEKLITEVLRIGVGVGARKWEMMVGDFVSRDKLEKAVRALMEGEGGEEMRRKAKFLGETAKKAVKEGGSSYNDMGVLTEELKAYPHGV